MNTPNRTPNFLPHNANRSATAKQLAWAAGITVDWVRANGEFDNALFDESAVYGYGFDYDRIQPLSDLYVCSDTPPTYTTFLSRETTRVLASGPAGHLGAAASIEVMYDEPYHFIDGGPHGVFVPGRCGLRVPKVASSTTRGDLFVIDGVQDMASIKGWVVPDSDERLRFADDELEGTRPITQAECWALGTIMAAWAEKVQRQRSKRRDSEQLFWE